MTGFTKSVTGTLTLSGTLETLKGFGISFDQTLPMISMAASMDQGLFLPSLTMSATVLTGETNSVFQEPLVLPMLTMSSTILPGRTVEADIALPMLVLQADTGDAADLTLPSLQLTAQMTSGGVISSDVVVPMISLASTVLHQPSTAALTLPSLELAATITQGTVTAAAATLPMLDINAQILTGLLATADVSLPLIDVTAQLYSAYLITASPTLPMLTINAELYSVYPETFHAWAMNTQNNGLTSYSNFNFNSFARIGDRYFAASSTGIYELTGDDDAGTQIDSTVVFKNDNFGDTRTSKILAVYVSAEIDGDMMLGITANGYNYTYAVPVSDDTAYSSRRIDTVRGEKAVHWQLSLYNVSGSDFRIGAVEPLVKKLGRRV